MTAHLKKAKEQMKEGFTLIELLIVIAILGVLAVVVLVAINPVEQLARTRDAGRISSVTQIGHAVEAYYTTQNATFPTEATWDTDLVNSGELTALPSDVSTTDSECAYTSNVNGWCYKTDTSDAVVYALLVSDSWDSQCAATEDPYAVFSTADGRGGVVCGATEPGVGSQTFIN